MTVERFFQVECSYKAGVDTGNKYISSEIERRLGAIFSFHGPNQDSAYPYFVEDEILGKALISVQICEEARGRHRFSHYINATTVVNPEPGEDKADYFQTELLPSACLDSSWGRLFYADGFKEEVLNYLTSLLACSTKGLDYSIFDLQKIVMFHGPPGCGKTSLCKALAQKLAVRLPGLTGSAASVSLVSVNCQSVFSKWFSESGKQISLMFSEIKGMAIKPNSFVIILIDEVESISMARSNLLKSAEPSDSIRATNTLLTQLDQLKQLQNVVLLVTTNMLESVDPAFLDRVDLTFELASPGSRAKYEIVRIGIQELMTKGLVEETAIDPYRLMTLIEDSFQGTSGRSTRKAPFLALSRCLRLYPAPVPFEEYFRELKKGSQRSL